VLLGEKLWPKLTLGTAGSAGFNLIPPVGEGVGHLPRQWLSCMCTSFKMHKGKFDPTLWTVFEYKLAYDYAKRLTNPKFVI